MSADDGRDPGLQPERTALSWTRTGLALVVASLVMARVSTRLDAAAAPSAARPFVLGVVLGVMGTSTGLALVVVGRRRNTPVASTDRRDGRMIATTAAACVLLGLGAVVTIFAGTHTA